MEKVHHLKFIEGEFQPEEANAVLCDIIGSKIRHHNLKILNIKVSANGEVQHSEERVEALVHVNQAVKEITQYAIKEGYTLKIDSTINIQLMK